jgi:polyisoprenoid-binding protein YceI
MHKLILVLALSFCAFANSLELQQGEIIAHTEVFGDSEIDPKTKDISSILSKDKNIESIRGDININFISLKSQKEDRDQHMYKLFYTKLYPKVSFEIKSIKKQESNYQINGILTLNNTKRNISSFANINEEKNSLNIGGNFSIKLTQFNIEPPTLLFLTVRDQIDIKYNLSYTKGE